jgi:hypothetical protein
MELVLQKQSNQLAESGSRPIGSSGIGGGGSGAAGGMGNLAQELIGSLQDLTSGVKKLITAVQFNTRAIGSIPSASSGGAASGGKGLETEVEGNRSRDAQTALLIKIEENTRGMGGKDSKKDKKKDEEWSFLDYIKGFGLALAATLGAIAGMIAGQLKTMKFFFDKIVDSIRWVSKTILRFATYIDDLFGGVVQKKLQQISTFVDDLVTGLRQRIGNVGKSIASFFEDSGKQFKKMFSFLEESDIGKKLKSVVNSVQDTFGKFSTAIAESDALKKLKSIATSIEETVMGLWKSIKGVFSGLSSEGTIGKIFKSIGTFFTDVGAYFSKISGVFSAVFKAFTKIFFFVGIIMGIFDTVTGAIDGFKKDGLLGGIKGAITGLINGVFNSLFDLIKDLSSWLLGKLGFKEAAAFLDSFSFQDLFTKLVDKVFDVILNPIKYITDAFDKLDLKALIFDPMSKAWTFLNDSLGGIPQKIVDNIKLYIMDPLTAAFTPVVDMFKDMASKVIGFFSEFKIPGVEVTIPYVNKTFGIGPWYPFKSNSKSDAAAPQGTAPAAAPAPQGTSAGTPQAANTSRVEFAKTDPRLTTNQPADASNVTDKSARNADAAVARTNGGGTSNTVIAPTVSNVSHKTELIKPPIRNQDSSVSNWLRKGMSF